MLKGTQRTPEEAKAIGLITDVFKKGEFTERVQAFADLMSKRSPVAIDAIKKSVHYGMDINFLHSLSLEMIQSIRYFDTEDAQKAMSEYLKIIKEKIDVPKDLRLSMAELLNILESGIFVDKFEGK
jgi:enoyl-CoA hydratase/carnithine racemase